MAEALYDEFRTLRRLAVGGAATGLGLIVLGGATDGAVGGWLLMSGLLLLLPAYLAWGLHRYNRIRVTVDHLQVGREQFGPHDFDRWFGVQPVVVLHPDEQASVEDEWPLPPDADVRIAGGSWGRRRGTRMLVMREASRPRRLVAVFTRHPQRLERVLSGWLVGSTDLGDTDDPPRR